MCVIMVSEKVRPTEAMIEKAFEKNKDGVGFAWREESQKEPGVIEVHWDKGIDNVDEAKKLFSELPLPFIGHFRASSPNFVVTGEMTHPFPIIKTVPLFLRGRTKGSVLFHNGFLADWQKECKEAAANFKVPIPGGKWSDTRAIAWLCSLYGPGYMEFIGDTQKGVIYGPEEYEYYTGRDGWKKINDVWCSNDAFNVFQQARIGGSTGTHRKNEIYCKNPQCCVVQPLDQDGYCPRHPKKTEPPKEAVKGNVTQGTGGSQGAPLPFLRGMIVSLAVAEALHKEIDKKGNRKLGKRRIREIRACYSDIAVGGKKEEKAWTRLKRLTLKLHLTDGSAISTGLVN